MDCPSVLHPLLGRVHGKAQDGVTQFLGLQYATLRDVLAPAHLVDSTTPNSSTVDAREYGPPVISPPGSAEMEMSFIQQRLPKKKVPPPSALGGLSLNITVPAAYPEREGRRLPVLVYIHGGGFVFGSSTYPHYDQAEVVRTAAARQTPIIAVNINYRLGIPGFLTSQELRNAGYEANNGLRDQKVALRWIQRYIAGFGGDPTNVTVVGQSAGAASVHYHLRSPEGLFQKAVLLSGTSFLMPPVTQEIAEIRYKMVLDQLALGEKTLEECIQTLTHDIPVDQLGTVPLQVPLGPVIDAETVPEAATFAALDGNYKKDESIQKLMLIDLQSDATIFAHVNLHARLNGITAAFTAAMETYFGTEDARKLLAFYKVDSATTTTPDPNTLSAVVRFFTDIFFYAPAVQVAQAFAGSTLAHFNEGNPWAGTFQGHASHLLDTAFLWQNYNSFMEPAVRAVAETFASDLVAFVVGEAQLSRARLPDYQQDGEVIVYGPSAEGHTREIVGAMDERGGRRVGFFQLAGEIGGLDRVRMAARGFLESSM
ncbi:hypothetical protein ARAM_002163 [Aspergillus rambellii]|uniref:Carboxylic ester hydrolase n=1 Tax=Aspergillus rambellii TaxID=308745 RepID=A0A0F8UUY6_9EURO|nr:hypothetical protein ARAM_002163 [Aspergillus rambellii]